MTPSRSRTFIITQDRWCWCGRAAALVIKNRRTGTWIESVCSEEHGQISIRALDGDVEERTKLAAPVDPPKDHPSEMLGGEDFKDTPLTLESDEVPM